VPGRRAGQSEYEFHDPVGSLLGHEVAASGDDHPGDCFRHRFHPLPYLVSPGERTAYGYDRDADFAAGQRLGLVDGPEGRPVDAEGAQHSFGP
jgi:hypothetical protein